MVIQGNCRGPLGAPGALNGTGTYDTTGAADDFVDIGGVLTVTALQPSGTYSGTLDVVTSF